MNSTILNLKFRIAEVADLKSAAAVLEWDQETYMPDNAGEVRALQVATLRKFAHTVFTSDETAKLLDEATADDQESDEARLLSIWKRDFERASKLPPELVFEKTKAIGRAKESWKQARLHQDFTRFESDFSRLVDFARQESSIIGYDEHPYDTLLDEFEPNMTTREVKTVFEHLRSSLVPIVQTIQQCKQPADQFLYETYDVSKLWDLGMDVLHLVGYDFTRGRQDLSTHPFSTTFDISDVRITTRIAENNLVSGLFSTLHEFGHALYEQGVDPKWQRTLLAEGTSLGIHESQSRLWENHIGRSQAFWEYLLPHLQTKFPNTLQNITLSEFYRAINKVQPSLIRVDADEVTYPLHVLLRFEIEADLIEGRLEVRELPELWRTKMQTYLGVVPENETDGILQDIHWSLGAFGYFPTYTLGTLYAAQFFEQASFALDNLESQIRSGQYSPLKNWLKTHIHQFGRAKSAKELVFDITNTSLSAEPWLKYIKTKYGDLYEF